MVMPEAGIYAATLQHEPQGPRLDACSYIGDRPTFGDGPVTFETFVLDVDPQQGLDLYDKTVTIQLLQRIRPDQAFESAEALIEQMHKDIQRTRQVLAQRP
jgi:riboflavin kinase/FMN adenylyltransferase